MIEKRYALLVKRAGRTTSFPLPESTIRFGYAPPYPQDLTLYDGALADIHGEIVYEPPEGAKKVKESNKALMPFHIKVHAEGVTINHASVPVHSDLKIQIELSHEIRVGKKYLLTIVETEQTNENGTASAKQPQRLEGARRQRHHHTDGVPPHLKRSSQHLLQLLPEIYQPSYEGNGSPSFLSRFLALLESEFIPLWWTIDNFDLFLDPATAPPEMLPWLASWYDLPFNPRQLSEEQQRALLANTPWLMRHKGTKEGLSKLMALYTGKKVEIDDLSTDDATFTVLFEEIPTNGVTKQEIEVLIDQYKPAHTTYTVEWPE